MHVGGLHLRRNDYIITIGSERNHTMMTFNEYNESTNSLKPVMIHKTFQGYMVFTPEGRLDDDFTSAGPFVSFEAAKRNAEATVGMTIKWDF
jgi:hypothetical protein